jgi:hypothetical protein
VLGYREWCLLIVLKSKNESDQEETTDAWGFEKPSTSGVPQKVKTISWEQGIGGIGTFVFCANLDVSEVTCANSSKPCLSKFGYRFP